MYLHLGNGFLARDEDVVGIFDLDNTTGSRITGIFSPVRKKQET